MTDQERIAQLEREVSELRGKVEILKDLARGNAPYYPVYPVPMPLPIYPATPIWYSSGTNDNTLHDGHTTTCGYTSPPCANDLSIQALC